MNKKKLNSKIEYLDFDKIKSIIDNKNDSIDIKSSDIINENDYKIYKYIPVNDIEILITNARRLDEPSKKLEELNTLSYYLDKKNKDEYNMLNNVLNTVPISEIKELKDMQKKLQKNMPLTIKFPKDYLWQIYYIKSTNKYYMIVPIQETEQQAFLYLLKKKVEKSKEKIYVPICNGEYSNEFFNEAKIKNFESILYFFTKNWLCVYEVYDKKENVEIYFTGKTSVYESIESDYKFIFKNIDEFNNFYKLTDTLFYLQTEVPNFFEIKTFVDETGVLHFYNDDLELSNDSLNNFYSKEINKAIENIQNTEKIEHSLKSKLNKLKVEEKKLNAELMYKQKQISTFLECKKTFLGRVKYFFKYKKKKNEDNNLIFNVDENKKEKVEVKAFQNNFDADIEDLIYVCKELKAKTISAETRRMDIKNLNTKICILKKKIENAKLYIKEIESHQKSIFEFWKFTNKDEKAQLTEAEIINKEENKNQIEKEFDFKEDLKEFATTMDLKLRKELIDEEINSILMTKTDMIKDINSLSLNGKITSENLEKIKESEKLFKINEKEIEHREKFKDIKRLLGINSNTTIEEYESILRKQIKNLQKAFDKINTEISLKVYCPNIPKKEITIAELNPKKLESNNNSIIDLYIVNIKQNTKILPFTNIVFCTNRNNTLPLGMNYSTEILLDLREIDLIKIKQKEINIFNLTSNSVVKLIISEFNI